MKVKITATDEERINEYFPSLKKYHLEEKEGQYFIDVEMKDMLNLIHELYQIEGISEIVIRTEEETIVEQDEYGRFLGIHFLPGKELVLEIYNAFRE